MAKEKKQEKEMSKTKKIVNITILVLQIIIIIACIAFSIVMVVSSQGNKELKLRNGTNLMPVMSNSMDGDEKDSFTTDDLVFVKKFKEDDNKAEMIKVGDIVTFKQFIGEGINATVYETHRVIRMATAEEKEKFGCDVITKGDYAVKIQDPAEERLAYSQIEGYYTGQIKGLGAVITFLKRPEAFFPLIVVPLVLLLLYNAYIIIKATLDAKFTKLNAEKEEQTQQAIAAALAAAGLSAPVKSETTENETAVKDETPAAPTQNASAKDLDVDEIKKKAIEDYIRQQAIEEYKASLENKKDEKEDKPSEETKEDDKD